MTARGSVFVGHGAGVISNESSAPHLVPPRPFSSSTGDYSIRNLDPSPSAQETSTRSTPPLQNSSATLQEENSPYKEIVDFLQTKKDKLNHMEIIGLTQSLRKNATKPAQEVIDYIEVTANVPSAALLETFKQPSDLAASPNKPLLFPPPTPAATNPSPARNRRRRGLYTGVGQSPRRIGGTVAREPQRTPTRLRLLHASDTPGEAAPSSNKKRLVGDSAIPIPSGSANGGTNPFTAPPSMSAVPFPTTSPIRPQRAAPTTNAGPSSRPTMAGPRNGPFGTGPRTPFARPEAPRQPSPLRKSNLGTCSNA